MRPLELTVQGFRSYREPATFDWRGRRLVGIVGPIGAGKSSLLDAISFALYGKTPAVERDTHSLIHQLMDACHVELRFEVDGQVWSAVRALRRKGPAGHALHMLADDSPGAAKLETITGERAVNERVELLLGLDFRAFCRSVLLAQNRFSEFLKATPAERDKVLKGVFGYERLDRAREVASARLSGIELELESLDRERRHVDEAREQLSAARREAELAEQRLHRLETAAPAVKACEEERATAGALAEKARGQIDELRAIAEALPPETDVEETIRLASAAEAELEEASGRAEETARLREEAEERLKTTHERLGDHERFRTFASLVTRHEEQAETVRREQGRSGEADAALAKETAELESLTGASSAASEELAAAEAALERATSETALRRDELLAAQHAEMAHELRRGLAVGEPCPVCAQPLRTLPRQAAAPKLKEAQRALARAEKAEAGARRDHELRGRGASSATAAVEGAHTRLEAAASAAAEARDQLDTAEAALERTKGELVERLGEGDPRELLASREAELRTSEEVATLAARAAQEALTLLEAARSARAQVGTRLASLANRLSGAWGRLGEERDVAAEPDPLLSAFAELRDSVVSRHERAETELADAAQRAETAGKELAELLDPLGLEADADFARELMQSGVVFGGARTRVEELERRIGAGGELGTRARSAEARRDLARRLAEDLKPSRFLAFLLEEERAELAALGSEHFELLTGGGYRFTEDDRFDVQDLNAAGAVRRAESLSGGETFLASLALALALAEMVARGGGRLDAFFLDEGFGSLDPEHLDRAMDGIGRLVSEDGSRLVVLVSHVAEMREAIEDLIVLDKHETSGDTMVRSGAGPAS